MVKKISSRLVYAVITFFLLTFFVFALSNMMKGNALDAQLAANPHMSQETYNALLHERGLDRPIPVRYLDWLTAFLHGDMGTCDQFDVPVSQILSERIGPTLILNFTALILAVVISIPLGVMAAYKPYSAWDNVSSVLSFVGASMPSFMMGLLGVYFFAVKLHWLPTQGMYYASQPHTIGSLAIHLVLPATIGALQMVGSILKQTRGAVLEVLNEDYIKTARAKGVKEVAVVIRHALRNALIPIITIIGLEVPYVIGGSVVLETIFAWPGMGSFLITSINARDFDPIMGITVVICVVVMLTSILLDFVYMFVDPRIAKEK